MCCNGQKQKITISLNASEMRWPHKGHYRKSSQDIRISSMQTEARQCGTHPRMNGKQTRNGQIATAVAKYLPKWTNKMKRTEIKQKKNTNLLERCCAMWVRPNEEYHKNINMLIKMGIISQLKLEKKSDSDPTVNNHNNFQSSQKCDVAVAWFLSSWDYLPLFSSQRVCGNGQFPQCRPAIDGVLRAWE